MNGEQASERGVRLIACAAGILVLYGMLVVVNATLIQNANDWVEVRQYPRALIRLIGTVIMAWGLLKFKKWAWWLSVVFGSLWALAGLVVIVLHVCGVRTFPLLALMASPLLITALVLLMLPGSRAQFHPKGVRAV